MGCPCYLCFHVCVSSSAVRPLRIDSLLVIGHLVLALSLVIVLHFRFYRDVVRNCRIFYSCALPIRLHIYLHLYYPCHGVAVGPFPKRSLSPEERVYLSVPKIPVPLRLMTADNLVDFNKILFTELDISRLQIFQSPGRLAT